jgi:predicted AAA+ superfamily ATPase
MYPISYGEIQKTFGPFEARDQLERWLVWGGYPEIGNHSSAQKREQLLGELVGSYLYRDLLELDGMRKPEKIVDLLLAEL